LEKRKINMKILKYDPFIFLPGFFFIPTRLSNAQQCRAQAGQTPTMKFA
jgi:hypothetical protein